MSHFSDKTFLHKTITLLTLVQKGPICAMDLYSVSADTTFFAYTVM